MSDVNTETVENEVKDEVVNDAKEEAVNESTVETDSTTADDNNSKPDNKGMYAYPITEPVTEPEAKAEKNSKKEDKTDNFDELIEAINDEDMKTIAKLLVEIKNDNNRVRKYAKRQTILALCSTSFCVVLVCAILYWGFRIIPMVENLAWQATGLVNTTNDLMEQTGDVVNEATEVINDAANMVDQTATVVDNLEKITTDIAATDLKGLVEDVNSLVVTSEESIGEAVEKIDAIDIDTLNQAINDLQAVVEPLAKLFKR